MEEGKLIAVGVSKQDEGEKKAKERDREATIAMRWLGKRTLAVVFALVFFSLGLVIGGFLPHGLSGLVASFIPGPLPSPDRPQFTCALLVNHTYGSVCVAIPSEPPPSQVHLQLLYCAGEAHPSNATDTVIPAPPQQVGPDTYQWAFIPNSPCNSSAEVTVWTDRAVGETASLQISVQAAPVLPTRPAHP